MPTIKPNESRHWVEMVIDHEAGTAQLFQYGVLVMNITHLPTPVPYNGEIELVALNALTAYNNIDWDPDE